MIVSWLVFPLVMGVVCLGCGLLLEAVAGTRLPGALLMPAGLALVVVLAQLAVWSSATAFLATPAVGVAALAGLVLGQPWRRRFGSPRWALAVAAGVFAVFAAPVVLSGQATFTGYIKLDDTATWLALTDHAMGHGSSVHNLPASTYGATLGSYLRTGYPLGAFLPLGVAHQLIGQDIAWLFQPYEAFLAAMLGLSLYWIVSRVLGSRPLAALCAFAAAQAATLYAYSLWGGVKEIAAAWLVALTAALSADAVSEARLGRAIVPVAVAVAAGLSTLSVGGAAWLGPSIVGGVLLAMWSRRAGLPLRQAVAFVPAAAVLAAPALAGARTFFQPASGVLTSDTELGNLIHPLNRAQALGIWPAGDFRRASVHPTVTAILLALLGACAVIALVVAWRRRAWELPLFALAAALAGAIVTHFGSPWVDGKAFATVSPAFVLAGMAGAAIAMQRRSPPLRLVGVALTVALLGGVLWSNALAYRDADLAPRSQLAELETIGKKFAGQGPTLMNDYDPYGARHFLRKADAESVSELRVHVIPLRNGTQVPKATSADLDRFPVSSLQPYRTIVLHRSPMESRPPAGYSLAWRGRYWSVWQRPRSGPRIVDDLPLGDIFQPGAVPSCSSVLALAAKVPFGGSLAAVERTRPTTINVAAAKLPPGWAPDPARPGSAFPGRAGSVSVGTAVSRTDSYAIWMGGSFKSRVRVYIDGRLAASARGVLQWEPYVKIGEARLTAGRVHNVRIVYDGPSLLHPGSGGYETGLGPLALSDETGNLPVTYVAPENARSLCGKYLDWIEALAPGGTG